MKQFRIAFYALIVIIIVSSSLAFKTKKGNTLCASNIAANTSCAVVNGKTCCDNGTTGATFYMYKNWDGTLGNCLSNRCATQVTLYTE